MTCKVRCDFKIITDVSSSVSLVTANIQGSSICSPKSLYKKTSNEILAVLKAVVETMVLKVPEAPTRHTPFCYELSAVTGVCQTASSQPHPVTTERKGEERTSFFTAQNVGRMAYIQLRFCHSIFFFLWIIKMPSELFYYSTSVFKIFIQNFNGLRTYIDLK